MNPEIESKVEEYKENLPNTLKPEDDHLDITHIKKSHPYYLITFAPAQFSHSEKCETFMFSEFLYNSMSTEFLEGLLQKRKEVEEHRDEPIVFNRLFESTVDSLLKEYTEFKRKNRLRLRNKIRDELETDLQKKPLEGGMKVLGTFKTLLDAKKAQNKFQPKFNTLVFTGQTGYWMPVNPHKFDAENYDTTNQKLNDLVRHYKEETLKTSKSFGMRTELYKRQGYKRAKELQEQTAKLRLEQVETEDSEIVEFPKLPENDPLVIKSVITDVEENPVDEPTDETVEVDLSEKPPVI